MTLNDLQRSKRSGLLATVIANENVIRWGAMSGLF